MKRVFDMCGVEVTFCNNFVIEKNIIVKKYPVCSAGHQYCGDGGSKDFFMVHCTIKNEIVAAFEFDGFTEGRKVLRTKEFEVHLVVADGCNHQVGKSLYLPLVRFEDPMRWARCTAPREQLNDLLTKNYKTVEEVFKNKFDLTSSSLEEEYREIVKKELEKLEKKKKEKEKYNKTQESIGDYNSKFGVTSTWCGDAGWMDDD